MRVRLAAAVAVLLLISAVIVTVLTHTPAFNIAGDLATPLRPGVTAPLDLAIANPHSYPITVTSVSVTVAAVTVARTGAPSRCAVSNFSINQSTTMTPITLAPHSHMTLSAQHFAKKTWPQIRMLKTRVSQNYCKGVTVELSYHASDAFWGQP
jgi:hypothetical protein